MSSIPRPALALGLAGLLPFLWGAAGAVWPDIAAAGRDVLGQRLVGVPALIAYGTVILCFMSGVLWGFAARAPDSGGGRPAPWVPYALSVLPALWVFFMVGGGGRAALSALLVGFVLVLVMDQQFSLWGLTPRWWMRLRVMLTAVAVACIGVGLWAS